MDGIGRSNSRPMPVSPGALQAFEIPSGPSTGGGLFVIRVGRQRLVRYTQSGDMNLHPARSRGKPGAGSHGYA